MDPTRFSYQHPHSGEWAHDLRDPLGEADHAFVLPALERAPPQEGKPLRILEIGFGRGINTARALALLQQRAWPGEVHCLGLEAFPATLQPWPPIPPELKFHCPWWGGAEGAWAHPEEAWSGVLRHQPAPEGIPADSCWDWVFLDLFSPARHAEDWRRDLFDTLTRRTHAASVITSYCCARSVRERLQVAGWHSEVLRPAGRRDTLRASRVAPSAAQA